MKDKFKLTKLNDKLSHLEPITEKGNLKYEDDSKEKVIWVPDPNGRWTMGIDPYNQEKDGE